MNDKMNDKMSINKHYLTITWGLLFLWPGILMIIPGNQGPLFLLGVGVILLGINLLRIMRGIPINAFSTTLGGLVSGLGLVAIFRVELNIPAFHLQLIPVVLIVIGLYLIIPSNKNNEQKI